MAATRLKSGTFLLWPYTLDRAWSMLSMSSPHGRLVCPGPPSRSPIADTVSMRHGALFATKQVRRCLRGCCEWLLSVSPHALLPLQ